MSQVEVERLSGRLITDAIFREKAALSLATSCYTEGFILSKEEVALLGPLDFSYFAAIAQLLVDAIRRT